MIDKLERIPFMLLAVIYLGFIGYQYYEFQSTPEGEYELHQVKKSAASKELDALKIKLSEGKKFMQVFELKKQELKTRSLKLAEYQGAMSDALDIPALIKLLLTEAKKIQIKVDHIEPGKSAQREFYFEQDFKLDVKGTYSQLVIFAQRVAQLQRILRIETFSLKPFGDTGPARVGSMLSAQLSIRAYQYTISKEDSMGKGLN